MDINHVEMGKRIREARKAAHLTQSGLAKEIGVSVSFMGHIERGTRHCSLDTLAAITVTLHCNIDSIVFDQSTRDSLMQSSFIVLTPSQKLSLQETLEMIRSISEKSVVLDKQQQT